jgi:threonine/homoserine/homoserine lactone efflux protein
VLGLLLVLVGIKQWRSRPTGDEDVALPKWMGALQGFTPVKAGGAGFLLSALNPKNLIFIVGGATAVAQTAISGIDQAIVWAIFAVIASLGVAAPVVIYFAMGDRAADRLGALKTWMARNNATIMAVMILIIAAKLIGDGISGLST